GHAGYSTDLDLPTTCPPRKPRNQSILIPGPRLVGATGFEPATTCTPSRCATRLRYAPGTSRRCDGLRGSGMYLPLPGGSSCSVGPGAAAGCCGGLGRVVQRALQHLAGPKRQYPACGDLDLLARLRIPPDARVLLAHLEVPEAGDLDLVPAL